MEQLSADKAQALFIVFTSDFLHRVFPWGVAVTRWYVASTAYTSKYSEEMEKRLWRLEDSKLFHSVFNFILNNFR